jgi:hypothetical protein
MGRIQAAVTKVSTIVFKNIQENEIRHTSICLDMEGGPFERVL